MLMKRAVGRLPRRPSASSTPSGSPAPKAHTASSSVIGRPPHDEVGTRAKPNMPPCISARPASSPAIQMTAVRARHWRGLSENTVITRMNRQTTVGRHCSPGG